MFCFGNSQVRAWVCNTEYASIAELTDTAMLPSQYSQQLSKTYANIGENPTLFMSISDNFNTMFGFDCDETVSLISQRVKYGSGIYWTFEVSNTAYFIHLDRLTPQQWVPS